MERSKQRIRCPCRSADNRIPPKKSLGRFKDLADRYPFAHSPIQRFCSIRTKDRPAPKIEPLGWLFVAGGHVQLTHFSVEIRAMQTQVTRRIAHIAARCIDVLANVVGLELLRGVGQRQIE